MEDLKRAKITRRAQRAQATKTWNKAEALMNDEINETNIQRLQVVLQTFDTKIEQLKKLDENISCKIETEKELESEIVEADDYLSEAGEETNKLNNLSQSPDTLPSISSLLTNTSRYKNLGGNYSNSKFKTPPNPSKPKACTFCNGSHKPNDCTVVSDPAARKQIAFQANLCFNCLNNHRVSQCKSKNRCRQCHQKHHTSLCVGNKERPEQQKPDPNTRQNIKDKDRNVQCMCTNGGDVAQTTNTSEQTSEVRATTSFGICPTTDEPSDEKDQPSENPPQREKRSAAVAAKKRRSRTCQCTNISNHSYSNLIG
ncbi:Hypothetical predicted protein [Paramuricea clavata]|uniref:Uncharacterized protein n=1 Tax=Paramuricea clavata TaxID=317549 RepID=A0A6S7FWN8_PARCT|nr:Hypothetical predicted protein [Paramuricea clavata]